MPDADGQRGNGAGSLSGALTSAAPDASIGLPHDAVPTIQGTPTSPHHSRLTFWPRIAIVLGLGILAYFPVFIDVISNALAGSRTAFLVVVPVWAAMIADRYRAAPRGVGDAETDWIGAICSARRRSLSSGWCGTACRRSPTFGSCISSAW